MARARREGALAALAEAERVAERGFAVLNEAFERPENRDVAERFVWRMAEAVRQALDELRAKRAG